MAGTVGAAKGFFPTKPRQKGRPRAGDELFARHYLAIREQAARFFCQRLGGGASLRNHTEPAGAAEAIDAAVDAVEQRLRSRIDQLRDAKKLEAWLFQLTLNICRDQWRHDRRGDLVRFESFGERAEAPVADDERVEPRETSTVDRLDPATRAVGKIAYVAPHDLDLAADELRFIADARHRWPDEALDALQRELGALHDEIRESRCAALDQLEQRLGEKRQRLYSVQRELRRLMPSGEDRALARRRLEQEQARLTSQRDRLIEDLKKSRPRLWRVGSEQLARFLDRDLDSAGAEARKRAIDAINQRLTRFRRAYREQVQPETSASALDSGLVERVDGP